MNIVQCFLRATGGFWLLRLPYLCLTLVCFGLVSGLNAASFTASPASGQQGARIRLSAERLSPSVSYNLQYFDTAATSIASVSSDAAGKLNTSIVLPSLPAGTGVLRLMRALQPLPAASARFTALGALSATIASPVQAGQHIAFEVNGLRPTTLTFAGRTAGRSRRIASLPR